MEKLPDTQAQVDPKTDPTEAERVLLRDHFSGKRDSKRAFKLIEVEVTGAWESFQGLAVDVSRSGLLLRIMDSRFHKIGVQELTLVRYTDLIQRHFADGVQIRFRGTLVRVDAEIVRIANVSDSRTKELIMVGCRFDRLLTADECAQIGIDPTIAPGDA